MTAPRYVRKIEPMKALRRLRVLSLAAVALCMTPVTQLSAQCAPDAAYQQSEAVKRRYPDPVMRFETPAFAPDKTDFTTHEEMTAFVKALEERSQNLYVRTAGHSQEGRALPALIFSHSGRYAAPELRRPAKPVALLVGQVHGNEPAGGEAMLAVAHALAQGELKPLLERISVVIVPRANPDGAHYFWRGTASCADVNRDHLKVDLPETMALRRITQEFQPEIFIDAHEFSVATRWIEKFAALQSYDLTMAYATHPNVSRALTALARDAFGTAVARDAERAGYAHFWYYTTTYDLKDKRVAGGGTAPDIGRNYAGLQSALSFLVENRGVGIGRDGFARRVHAQYVALSALLRTAAERAGEVRAVVQAAREDIVRRGRVPSSDDRLAITLEMPTRLQTLTMIDPESGAAKSVEVQWIDPREARPALSRARPYAYLVLPPYTEVVRRLSYSGIEIHRLKQPAELEVESYEVIERRAGDVFIEGHIRSMVTTQVTTRRRTFPAGTYVFPMGQPGANLLVAAMEPESGSGFVSLGLVPVDKRGLANPQEAAPSEVPIFRLMRPTPLDTQVLP